MTVYLLAAGPGDPGLWTVRAEQLLAAAPAVVCDRELVEAVMAVAPRVPVEAVAGAADAIPALIELARAARGVVRVARGDRLVWEHGGREAAALTSAGIAFTVEPAVVAAFAGPAADGVPVMARPLAATLAVAVGVDPPAITGGTIVTEAGDGTAPTVTGAVTGLDLRAGAPA